MSKITEGCLAIIVKGKQLPHIESNVGKVVLVGKFIGKIPNFPGDHWEVDRPLTYVSGKTHMHAPEQIMERIDYDENQSKKAKIAKPQKETL